MRIDKSANPRLVQAAEISEVVTPIGVTVPNQCPNVPGSGDGAMRLAAG